MKLDGWTFALQAINALVLVWLLARFLFKPVARIIAERQAAAAAILDQAEATRTAAGQQRAAADRDRQALAAGREAALAAATREAAQARERLLAAARDEAQAHRAQAEAALAEERQRQAAADDRRATALALAVAARLLGRLPPAARVEGFLDGLCSRLGALPAATRDAFLAPGARVVLAAPRALAAEEQEACGRAIAAVLGRHVPLAVAVEPALLAGLELRCDAVVVSNHLRGDLDRVEQELVHAADA